MKNLILQDIVLNTLRRDRLNVKIVCSHNLCYEGVLRGFDNYTVILDAADGTQNMIYKYNIVAIECDRQILNDHYKEENGI